MGARLSAGVDLPKPERFDFPRYFHTRQRLNHTQPRAAFARIRRDEPAPAPPPKAVAYLSTTSRFAMVLSPASRRK
jgi:hypothetical protein